MHYYACGVIPKAPLHLFWLFSVHPMYLALYYCAVRIRFNELHILFVQFLPVYVPSEDEKKDASLFARNVRAVMAR